MKPEIYKDSMDELEFLTEHERAYLNLNEERITKHILNRAKMFASIHRVWKEFNPKDNSIRKLSLTDWKKKAYRILNLQFKMTNEQSKGIVDSYFQKVSMPKGGLVK